MRAARGKEARQGLGTYLRQGTLAPGSRVLPAFSAQDASGASATFLEMRGGVFYTATRL
jgi:hypothetical protein